jgi:hypothetical protein
MIALSGSSEKAIRAQIAESVSLIAELDFPERWPDLIDVRQQSSLIFSSNSHIIDSNSSNLSAAKISTSTLAYWKQRIQSSAHGAPKPARTRFGPPSNWSTQSSSLPTSDSSS